MFLADTSVWIDYFRGVASSEARRLDEAIAAGEEICVCGVIVAEILQGIRGERHYRKVESLLDDLTCLAMSRRAYVRAAEIYRADRRKGKVIRNTVDCLIAACAIDHGLALLTKDKDFQTIARVSGLKLLEP